MESERHDLDSTAPISPWRTRRKRPALVAARRPEAKQSPWEFLGRQRQRPIGVKVRAGRQ